MLDITHILMFQATGFTPVVIDFLTEAEGLIKSWMPPNSLRGRFTFDPGRI